MPMFPQVCTKFKLRFYFKLDISSTTHYLSDRKLIIWLDAKPLSP